MIGLFLTYIGLVMMATDQLTAIRNQDKVGAVFDRILAVDERLFREHIEIDNNNISRHIRFMILLTIGSEVLILISSYILLVDYSHWMSILWIFTSVPTFYSSLDKIWFASMLSALKQRFEAINIALEEMVETHEKLNALNLNSNNETTPAMAQQFPPSSASQYDYNLGYLYKELNVLETHSFKGSGKNKVTPSKHFIFYFILFHKSYHLHWDILFCFFLLSFYGAQLLHHSIPSVRVLIRHKN